MSGQKCKYQKDDIYIHFKYHLFQRAFIKANKIIFFLEGEPVGVLMFLAGIE